MLPANCTGPSAHQVNRARDCRTQFPLPCALRAETAVEAAPTCSHPTGPQRQTSSHHPKKS